MIDLFKLHWQFIRHPGEALDNHVPMWPLKYGIILYMLNYGATFFQSGKMLSLTSDVVSGLFGLSGPLYLHLFILVSLGYGVVIQYFLQPQIVRRIAGRPKEAFQTELLRRLIFFSPTANIIVLVIVVLPLQLVTSLLTQFPSMSSLSLVLIGLLSVVSLWLIVPGVNTFVLQWKGLARYFNMNAGQIILAEFVIPLILALPLILVYGSSYLHFMQKYLQ